MFKNAEVYTVDENQPRAEAVAVKGTDIVYVGDYHTLPHAQNTLVKLLLGLAASGRDILLCLEMVRVLLSLPSLMNRE